MMQTKRLAWTWVVLVTTATGCGTGTPGGPVPEPAPSAAAAPGPGPTLCAELDTLIDAARKNFPELRRPDRPIVVDHEPGFEATVVLAGAVACRILTSEPPYFDAYRCDLAGASSQIEAKAVVDRWAAVVATCPRLATWSARAPSEQGRTWELETDDNHLLAVQVLTAGEDTVRPTLTVRCDEI